LAVACCTLAAPASAAPKDRAALEKISETMKGDYAMGRYEQAEAILLGTDQACADRCSAPVKAQIWLYIGCVRGTGNADQDGARTAFQQALELDPSLAPDPGYSNEETCATYRAVRAALDLGPDTESVSLSRPPAAAPGVTQPSRVAVGRPPQAPVARQSSPAAPDDVVSWDGADYRQGDPIPPGYHVETSPSRRLVIAGSIVFGAAHLTALFWSAALGPVDEKAWQGAIPVAGPWALAGHTSCEMGGDGLEGAFCVGMFLDGLAQATGALLLAAGLSTRTAHLVPDRPAQVTISPIRLGRSSYGLGVVGAF
jgi:hypothetical protein